MPRRPKLNRVSALAPVRGQALSQYDLIRYAISRGEKPPSSCHMPIQSRAVVSAEEKFGFGSTEHKLALQNSQLAFEAYLKGESWSVVEERPSLQQRGLSRREKEIAVGGARGGGKSMLGIMFLGAGNFWEPDFTPHPSSPTKPPIPIPVNQSYLHHPHYFGLCIRKNQGDLDDWVEEAKTYFRNFGGAFKGRPDWMFEFPSGARIRTGHLADPRSYEKYIGKSIHRIVVEELIQIENPKLYLYLLTSCRSKFPEIHPQVMVSFNPIGGPGVYWVHDRFIEPRRIVNGRVEPILDPKGNPIHAYNHDSTPVYPEPVIEEEVPSSVFQELGIDIPPLEQRLRKRVFLPARLIDNPFLMHNTDYVIELASIPDEDERRALLFGEWVISAGSYFSQFRPSGPITDAEPDIANHVIPPYPAPAINIIRKFKTSDHKAVSYSSVQLQPWWVKAMGGDWGMEHDASFLWFCQSPHKQTHVYRERVFNQTPPEVAGAEIARESIPDLNSLPDHSLTLWLGWDPSASNRVGGERVLFEYIAKGIRRILGPNSTYLPDTIIRQLDEEAYQRGEDVPQKLIDSIRSQRQSGITIRRAPDHRVIGWQLVKSMFRWTPILLESYQDFDPSLALRILFDEGEERYKQYVSHCSQRSVELLPKLQIWSNCERLIEAIPRAQKDEKNPEDVTKRHWRGADSLDSLRYGLMGMREDTISIEPKQTFVERRMEEIITAPWMQNASVNDLIRTRHDLEREHKSQNQGQSIRIHHPTSKGRLASRMSLAKVLYTG